jgi:replicative DNA helicase
VTAVAIVTEKDAPPFVDRAVEKTILGACLVHGEHTSQFSTQGVLEHHFYSRHHQLVWRRLEESMRAESGAGYLEVRTLLSQHGELDEVGPAYLTRLMDGETRLSPQNVHTLATRLIDCATCREANRRLQRATEELLKRGSVDGTFLDGIATEIVSLKERIRTKGIPDHVRSLADVMTQVRARLDSGPTTFIHTPWPTLNSMLGGGFVAGELIFMGARPGLGKSAAAAEISTHTARLGHGVLLLSREMLSSAVGERMIAQQGLINAGALRRGGLTGEQWEAVEQSIRRLQHLPIYLTHAPLRIRQIYDLVGALCAEGDLRLVIVDYLQLIQADPEIRERRLQVEAVSAGLKAITIDYGVAVLCLSSLSRPPEANRRPSLASLRESGNLEHDGDTVILLHRPDEMQPLTECVVAKARNGRQGVVELHLRGEHLKFEERTDRYGH